MNWKVGIKAAPVKSKVMRNQYCELVMYETVAEAEEKELTILTRSKVSQMAQLSARI